MKREGITDFVYSRICKLTKYYEENYNDPPSNKTVARIAIAAVRKYDRLKKK